MIWFPQLEIECIGRDWMSDMAENNDRPLTKQDFTRAKRTHQERIVTQTPSANTDEIRKHNVAIYASRAEQGLDIWTGQPLTD